MSAIIDINVASGDIIIIKDLISKNKWQYTSYVYDDGLWQPMDGNYNAENVYFDEDLITTTEIGNITLTDGSAIIPAAGKNLKEVFETIFVKEENPVVTQPSIILTCKEAEAYEVGTVIKPTYNVSLYPGDYSFGPSTNVVSNGWAISDNFGNSSVNNKGEFVEFIVEDDTDYKITAMVMHSNGTIPVTNLGNEYLQGQIKANSISISKSFVTGYRKSFYGITNDKDVLTSEKIRSLNHYEQKMVPGASIKVNLPVGAMRVVFAYPADLPDLVSITDNNGFEANIITSFKQNIVSVEGKNHYSPIDYKVYTIEFARPYNDANYYTFTLGEED